MADIDFPDNPSLDEEFTAGERTWVWNGTIWEMLRSRGVTKITVAEIAPLEPDDGELWFNTLTKETFLYHLENWMEIGPPIIDHILQRISTKGELVVAASANTAEALSPGPTNSILVTDPTAPLGVRWNKELFDDIEAIKSQTVVSVGSIDGGRP